MYYIRLSGKTWLGHNGDSVFFDDDMKYYRSLSWATKALAKAVGKGLAWDPASYGVYTIDWSVPHCPSTKVFLNE